MTHQHGDEMTRPIPTNSMRDLTPEERAAIDLVDVMESNSRAADSLVAVFGCHDCDAIFATEDAASAHCQAFCGHEYGRLAHD